MAKIDLLTLEEKIECLNQLTDKMKENMKFFPKWKKENELSRTTTIVTPQETVFHKIKRKFQQEEDVLRMRIMDQIENHTLQEEYLRLLE